MFALDAWAAGPRGASCKDQPPPLRGVDGPPSTPTYRLQPASHALWPCESETRVSNEVKIVTSLLLSRNVKVTPASECWNPSMPCGGAYMAEFIGSYIAVLVVMFLMVRMGGV